LHDVYELSCGPITAIALALEVKVNHLTTVCTHIRILLHSCFGCESFMCIGEAVFGVFAAGKQRQWMRSRRNETMRGLERPMQYE
jgi:hypothetical protein